MSTSNGRHLTRADILASPDLPEETLEVPRWGGTILVKAVPTSHPRYIQYWSGKAREELSDEEKQVRRLVGAAIMAAHDVDTGERLFKFTDADELREKHYNSVIQVANLGLTLAGNTEDEEQALTLNALLRVANYAQAHAWPDGQQDQLAAMLTSLITPDENVEAEIIDDPDDEDDEGADPEPAAVPLAEA
jgi:hypothetical protein